MFWFRALIGRIPTSVTRWLSLFHFSPNTKIIDFFLSLIRSSVMSPGLFSIYLQVWTFCNRERKKNCVPFAFRSGICICCFRLRCVFHLWEIGGRFVYWRYFSLTSSWMGCFLFCIWFSSIFVKENSERGLKVRLRNWNVLGFILGVHFDFFTLILRMIIKHVIAIWWFLHPCYGFVGSWEPCLCFAMWFRCNLVIDLFWPLSRMKILCLKLKV